MKQKNILNIKNHKRFLKELAESKKRNFEDNLKFVTWYALWVKKSPNKKWSSQQNRILGAARKATSRR